MNRRAFLRNGTRVGVATLAGVSFLLKGCHTEEDMIGEPNWIVGGDFTSALIFPPTLTGGGALTAGITQSSVLKGKMTTVMGYANGILGPTFDVTSGTTVNVSLKNNLPDETNIHWHGLVLPEDMDGHPRHIARTGESLNYLLPIKQRAGTYWYHPHPHGMTAKQVFMGLAGFFIVRDEEERALNLPSGEFELPLVIQDKRFENASFDYSPTADEMMSGYLGENILVNGVHGAFHEVGTSTYRLRVLNGSTARVYNLAFSNSMPFTVIGADGGLLPRPHRVTSILLGPGERLDILVDFSKELLGSDVFLLSRKFSEFNAQGRQSFNILRFRVTKKSDFLYSVPEALSAFANINPANAVGTRTFDISAMAMGGNAQGMGRHSINGRVFDMDRVDETVVADSTEIWEFDNSGGDEIHPMHIHGVQFQVLERRGGRNVVIASETGWKDTVLVMPGERVRVIMKFPAYRGIFVMHCHNLEHEDDGMMLNYRIT